MDSPLFKLNKEIILSSTSPQRYQIMEELKLPFKVLELEVEEVKEATPADTVLTNAKLKASMGVQSVSDKDVVILAADTVLSMNGEVYGKPVDAEEARKYLEKFSGNRVMAFSGVAGARTGEKTGIVTMETAEIEFFPLPIDLIDWYVSTGEPLTRAGAFGISRIGEILVKSITGNYSCVAGLPKRSVLAVLSCLLNPSGTPDFINLTATSPIYIETFEL